MPARLPSLTLIRLWAALLLAAIGLQASIPAPAPFEQRHGSAFSAATPEVALASHRPERALRQAPLAQPFVPPPVAAIARVRVASVALPARPAPRPASTAPPVAPLHATPVAPRAPPVA